MTVARIGIWVLVLHCTNGALCCDSDVYPFVKVIWVDHPEPTPYGTYNGMGMCAQTMSRLGLMCLFQDCFFQCYISNNSLLDAYIEKCNQLYVGCMMA